MEKVTGTCIIRIDGRSIRSKAGAKLMLGGFERTPVYADGQLIGFSEKPIASQIDATLAHTSSTDLAALNEVSDAAGRFETDTGVVFNISGMTLTKPPEITGGEGDATVTFMGKPAVQQ